MEKFLQSRVCEEWKRSGNGIVSPGTVNVFKMRLDHHLRVYLKAFAFHPLLMVNWPSMKVLSSWIDPGNPGNGLHYFILINWLVDSQPSLAKSCWQPLAATCYSWRQHVPRPAGTEGEIRIDGLWFMYRTASHWEGSTRHRMEQAMRIGIWVEWN